jgi:hypothetical protein
MGFVVEEGSSQHLDSSNIDAGQGGNDIPPPYAVGNAAAASAFSPPSEGPKPKIVATRSFLTVPGAGTFCSCYAASLFLTGGVVSAEFLNNIMSAGIELYRKAEPSGHIDTFFSIEAVLKKYGRSHLNIQAITNGLEDPKRGFFVENDSQHDLGIRKLMAACRNEQERGWQIVLIEFQSDSFCACLPPKGSSNKFWFFDFFPRSNVQSPGAYALVHSSLLQMQDTMELVLKTIARNHDDEILPFLLYKIQKFG